MEKSSGTFPSFEDLDVYRLARQFRIDMYRIAATLPEYEKYGLASQMRRAAVSLTNAIAEGHGRYHFQENIQFLRQGRGSLQELIDDLNTCADEKYLTIDQVNDKKAAGALILKKINGYIKYLKQRKEASTQLTNKSVNQLTK